MILPGSYANGFAPRDGQPLHPELWRGCVGAWAPCLGPTGFTLRDWSGRQKHSALVNMTAGDDWVAGKGRYALDFDETNDFGNLGSGVFLPSSGGLTISWWEYVFATAGPFHSRFRFNTGTQAFFVFRSTMASYATLSFSRDGVASSLRCSGAVSLASAAGSWVHFAIVGTAGANSTTPADWSLYENGVSKTIDAGGAFSSQTADVNQIGWDGLLGGAGCLIDDIAIYNRALLPREVKIRSSLRGIAYELAPRRRSSSAVQFNRRRRLLVGAGS